jgi:hypothetical protein
MQNSDQEISDRKKALMETVEGLLPDFVQSCRQSNDLVVIHQDSFAADYQEDEYRLLGMAIKVAGIFGKNYESSARTGRHSMRESNLSSYNKSL